MNIVITGGTRGIGLGLVKEFLVNDCNVVFTGTKQESLDKAIKELPKKYLNKVHGVVVDVRIYSEIEKLLNEAINKFGPIDIWVNSAGVAHESKKFLDLDVDDYEKTLDINLRGLINASGIASKFFIKQGYGKLFNMEGFGSDGRMGGKMSVYGTTKRAVRYFTNSLALELKDTKVIIGRISPGMVLTDLSTRSFKDDEETRKTIKVYNILADKVEPVTKFLVDGMIKCDKTNQLIAWLTTRKIMRRFLTAPFIKREIISENILNK